MKHQDFNDLMNMPTDERGTDTKYNLFRFQDHLIKWLGIASDCFFMKDYAGAFSALENIFIDSTGFFSEEENLDLSNLYAQASTAFINYNNYNISFPTFKGRANYIPPMDIYPALIKFRMKLLYYMAKHQMLIPIIKKGIGKATTLV